MKTIKVFYNNDCDFILNEVEEFKDIAFVEAYNLNNRKHMKKVKEAFEDFGTKKLPLVVFEDENFEPVGAIWSEQTPSWNQEIAKKLESL